MQKVAVVTAKGLGDGLISMVLSQNLLLSGFEVTTFSSALCGLQRWFPSHKIHPHPSEQDYDEALAPFDHILAADYSIASARGRGDQRVRVLRESDFDKSRTLVDNLAHFCQEELTLPFHLPDNGIVIPQDVVWKKYPKRVVIHPTSADPGKNWPRGKFLEVASYLAERGWVPAFCVSADERPEWASAAPEGTLCPHLETLDALASFVAESSYLIGNDSGTGHLASSLGIPTVSLFAKKSYSNLWRPGFGPGIVVSPYTFVPFGRLRQKTWKTFLTVGQVKRAFEDYAKEERGNASASPSHV